MERDRTPQAGAIPYRTVLSGEPPSPGKRRARTRIEVLLVTTSSGRWSIPKGTIDIGHQPHETASVEALEEAGVIGVIEKPALGTFDRRRAEGDVNRITVFALRVDRVLDRWQEQSLRQREWLAPDEAAERCGHDDLARMILALANRVASRARRMPR